MSENFEVSTMEKISEIEREETNVLPFEKQPKLSFAGKEPPTSPNWLSELQEGSVFLIKDKTSAEYVLTKFWLAVKEESYCLLSTPTHTGMLDVYVEPTRFCQKYSFVEELGMKDP